ncbi:MAG: DUF4168 domain-containing protein [Bacteroidetes bacterium]|jgi:hypothetical protein|nr:DUF4168 domain-containing protein [Bacteroidota bacterium]
MTFMRKLSILTLSLNFIVIGLMAQVQPQSPQKSPIKQEKEQISDSTLKLFAGAIQIVQVVNQQAQQQMGKAVVDAGLEVKRYQEIQMASQNPDAEVDITKEEMEKVKLVSQDLQQIQTKAQAEMQEKIGKEGLTLERYQELAAIIQSDPELMQRFQQMMQN